MIYKYENDDIENYKEDNFDDFEKGETTSASDSTNNNVAVSMITDIADIISMGDNNDNENDDDDDNGGCGRGWRRRQCRVLSARREDGDNRYDIGGSNRSDINDRDIEDENNDNNYKNDENN